MHSQLTKDENIIVSMFEEISPSWKSALNAQIYNSEVSRTDLFSSYFVNFRTLRYVESVPCNVEVPVEMIVGEVRIPSSQILRRVNGHIVTNACSFFVPDEYAVGIQFHFKSGYLYELEVYSLSGKKVSLENIGTRERTYLLYSEI